MSFKPKNRIVAVRTTALHEELWADAADSAGLKLGTWIRSVLNERVANRLAQRSQADALPDTPRAA